MGLYRRDDSPFWWLQYFAAGERIRESSGTDNKQEALQLLRKRKREIKAYKWHKSKHRKATFAEIVSRYCESVAFTSISRSTRRFYAQRLQVLISKFADYEAMSLTRRDVEGFAQTRAKTVSATTVNHEVTTLSTVLRWAVREEYLPFFPFNIDRLKPARDDFRSRVLSVSEEKAILAHASDYQQAMIIAALDAGMHKKEIFGQRWEDINFERNIIVMTESKKGRVYRLVPLTLRFKDTLESLNQKSDHVFTYRGRRILTDIKKGWYRILEDAGVAPIRFHDLRATYRTRLEELGVPGAVSMALMGHKRGSVNDRYTRPQIPALREAIGKLDVWLMNNGLYFVGEAGKVLPMKQSR